MSTIRPEFHTSLVSLTLEDIFYQRSSIYYFLGKIEPWGNGDEPPVAPINSYYDDTVIRNNMAYLRRVSPGEVSLVTTRHTWTSGTVYDHWDHTIEMQELPFFVITDEFNVYKCLDNNNNAPSTVKPTTNSLFPIRTSDGYLWKYMYNVPSFKRTKFLSRNNMPVQKALTDSFYNKGAVEQVVVTDPGSGYTDLQQTSIVVSGPTTGEDAAAEISLLGPLGEITGFNIISGGIGYTAGAIVEINSATGTGAQIEIVQQNGVITDLNIVNAGVGYSLTDTVSISVGGAILTPVVSQNTGSILQVRIDNPGAGYTTTPLIQILQYPETGVGKYGNAGAVIKPIVYQGSIVNVTIEDPGVNYPADNATTVVISGDGTGAQLSPVVYNGRIVDIIVENSGTDYTYMDVSIVGAGTGATAQAVLTTSDFTSDQSVVEQVAVKGAIYCVVITNNGNNYSEEATITITGDGTGATAEPVFAQNGGISYIRMTSFGQNYTYANVIVNDPNRPSPNNFDDLSAYVVLPPTNGHGYDATKELYADRISIFTALRDDEQLTLLEQDYRQYGLILNPTSLFTAKRVTSPTIFPLFTINLASTDYLDVDTVLINNDKRYRVVSINGNTIKVQQLNSIYSQPSGIFYEEQNTSAQYNIQSVSAVPNVNKYSGNLIYVTNNTPFVPTSENSIAIRTYIKL